MIVLDASAAVALLLNLQPRAARLRERLDRPGESLHVPHFFDVEVAHVRRRYVLRDQVPVRRAQAALRALIELEATRYPHAPLLDRIWELRANLTAYDAAYIALAEALNAPLVTLDERLANAPGHNARIEAHL